MRPVTLLKGMAFSMMNATSSIKVAYPFGFERFGVGVSGLLSHPLVQCVSASFEPELIIKDESLRKWLADGPLRLTQSFHTTPTVGSVTFLLVDREWGVVVWPPGDESRYWTVSIVEHGHPLMTECAAVFDDLLSDSDRLLLHDTRLHLANPDKQRSIIIGSNEFWNRVIDYFSHNPQQLYGVEPRRFEELIAELLARQGLNVTLTPAAKDGGVDILAFADTSVGKHLYLVECKRYAHSNPVGVELIRSLYGVVEARRATAGMLVTTSSFTDGAIQLQRSLEHRISLKPFNELTNWLRQSSEPEE